MISRSLRYGVLACLVHLGLIFGVPAAAQSQERPLIWVFGDSLTAGYGLPPRAGFTTQLEAGLRRAGVAAEIRNGGVSGDTAAQGRARLLWGLRGLKAKPDLVILELGANDMLRGLPPAQTARNLDLILAELRRREIPVLIAGMRAAPNLGSAYRRDFDAIFPNLARQYRLPLYPFFLDGVVGNRALLQADGMHPNARGVTIVVAKIVPAVKAALR